MVAFFLWRRFKPLKNSGSALHRGIFMYNGHNFDAYEVLGLSKRATLIEIEQKWQELNERNGSDREFLLAAVRSLRR